MRHHAESIEVRRRDDVPDQFLWRDRLYVIREVLAHWVEAGAWWCSSAASALVTGDVVPPARSGNDLVVAPIPSSPKWAQRAWGEPAPDVGAVVGPAAIDDSEQEFWRVEAAAGRTAGTGVYDLCFDWSGRGWTLARVLD